jgi:type III pantothenate kinase
MLLAINANNTNVKFAIFDGDQLAGSWRCASDPRRTADEYAVWLSKLMEIAGHALPEIEDVIIASVVPDGMFNLKGLCRDYLHQEPIVIGEPGVELGVRAKVDRPEEVGADRLVNAVEAKHSYGGPAIVVDYGTATTFDVVDGEGDYCGGVIAPGINLSVEALFHAAAKLPRIAIRRPRQVIGRNTIACMESGIFWGYVGLVEGLVRRIKVEFGKPMQVISTGGLAPLFEGATDVIDRMDPDLTLRGLLRIWRMNRRT